MIAYKNSYASLQECLQDIYRIDGFADDRKVANLVDALLVDRKRDCYLIHSMAECGIFELFHSVNEQDEMQKSFAVHKALHTMVMKNIVTQVAEEAIQAVINAMGWDITVQSVPAPRPHPEQENRPIPISRPMPAPDTDIPPLYGPMPPVPKPQPKRRKKPLWMWAYILIAFAGVVLLFEMPEFSVTWIICSAVAIIMCILGKASGKTTNKFVCGIAACIQVFGYIYLVAIIVLLVLALFELTGVHTGMF